MSLHGMTIQETPEAGVGFSVSLAGDEEAGGKLDADT